MLKLASTTVNKYGYDQQGIIDYKFNSLGFRSPEPSTGKTLIVLGNSISFGIGLDEQDTYGYQTAQALGIDYLNLSIGCYKHENQQYICNIKNVANRNSDDIFVIQINNLARAGDDCVAKFLTYFDDVSELLKHKQKLFIYWDDISYTLPKSVGDQILIYNKFHLDTSILDQSNTFGRKSHKTIAQILRTKLA
jgi:hypothetical protein